MDTYCKYCPKNDKRLAVGEHGGNAYCERYDHKEAAWKEFTNTLSWNKNKRGLRLFQNNRHNRSDE